MNLFCKSAYHSIIDSIKKRLGGIFMCYYIGIEDLVANALIEIVDKTKNRSVSFKKLNEYGAIIIRTLNSQNKESILLLSRDKTDDFIHNCTEYFTIREDDQGESFIILNDGITTDQLREKFRVNLSFNVLLAFINKQSLEVLGVF